MTNVRTPREQVLKELGQYIESKMKDRERYLMNKGIIEKPMSRSQLAGLVGVSRVWMNDIISGNKVASDNLLIKIATTLETDEDEIFRVARRLHPNVHDYHLREYLGEYYIEGMNELD
jgi:transcriptional regulator with XRE-family HTH domain